MRFLFALIIMIAWSSVAIAYDVETIQDNADASNRIDIVIMGDGYRVFEQQKMSEDADAFLETFWSYEPLGQYRNFFNIKLVHVISNENGADYGTYGDQRDTALGGEFNCMGIDRLLCVDSNVILNVAAEHMPEYEYIFVMVNDPKYGGGGGPYSSFSTHPSSGIIAAHEFGHSLGGLADEYTGASGYEPCIDECPEPNATLFSTFEDIKWNTWIDPLTPLPTPDEIEYDLLVGAFEGCRYESTGVFRPQRNCLMQTLTQDFCTVCKEALVKAIYTGVSPIDKVLPGDSFELFEDQGQLLRVYYPTPAPDTVIFTWSVDGNGLERTEPFFVALAGDLKDGTHEITVNVVDSTSLVNDFSGLLEDNFTWQVEVFNADTDYDTDTDTYLHETDDETDTQTEDTQSAGEDTQSETEETDTSTGADENQLLCSPDERRCEGVFQWSKCNGQGTAWEHGGYCDKSETCIEGQCQPINNETENIDYSSTAGCQCTNVMATSGVSLIHIISLFF